MAGVALSCEGVVVRREGRAILRAPALAIAGGETLVVLGPNGAGKTTLLGVLAGLDAADEGTARIGPAPATGLAARRRVALLPQRAPMLRGDVLGNVALPLRLRGVARKDRESRAREALAQLGVATLAGRAASTLSGGEARRVAIARALVARPEALLLDEPLEGVDPESRERLLADLLAAARAAGTTLVFVTHDRDEAVRAGGRIALLWGGDLRSTGTLDELLRAATPEIARWLGESNLLSAVVSESMPDGIEALVGAQRIRVAGPAPVPSAGAVIRIVVPRESIEIRTGPPGPTSARNVLPARVLEIVPREGRTEVVLDAAGARLVAVVTRWAVEELALAPGREVQAVFKATACHWVAGSG